MYFSQHTRVQLFFFCFSAEHLHSISKMELFEEWLAHGKDERNVRIFEFLSTKFHFRDVTEDSEREIKMKLASYSSKIAAKWVAAGKSKERFLAKNKRWLEAEDIKFHVRTTVPRPSTSFQVATPAGRPRKDFEEASFKTKKRRVEDLVRSRSVGELMTAAEVAVRSTGNRNIATVIRKISESSESASASVSLKNTSSLESARKLSGDEALAYYIDSKSTTHSYKQTRKWSMKAGHHVFPKRRRVNCVQRS